MREFFRKAGRWVWVPLVVGGVGFLIYLAVGVFLYFVVPGPRATGFWAYFWSILPICAFIPGGLAGLVVAITVIVALVAQAIRDKIDRRKR